MKEPRSLKMALFYLNNHMMQRDKRVKKTLAKRLSRGEFKTPSRYTDPEGIVRVGCRADKALVCYETSHPVFLPRDHWISHLIIQHDHQFRHLGVAATVAKTRTKYWIVRAHDLAKSVKFRYVVCREIGAKVEAQVMADLPRSRLSPLAPPFHNTSCDYLVLTVSRSVVTGLSSIRVLSLHA